jgi:hypothetical protein
LVSDPAKKVPHHFTAEPDPAFPLNADPDPAFPFNADPDPDPAPRQSDAKLQGFIF